jgi:hypothetical protein
LRDGRREEQVVPLVPQLIASSSMVRTFRASRTV